MKILFLTHHFLEDKKKQDPFRDELISAISQISDELLYIQTNDFHNEWVDQFHQPSDEEIYYKKIVEFKPSIVVSLNSAGITDQLISLIPGAEYKIWFVDNPWRIPENLIRPLKNCANVKLFGASTPPLVWLHDYFQGQFKVEKLLVCCNPNNVLPMIPLRDRKYDFAYIGSLWNTSEYGQFIKDQNPTKENLSNVTDLLTAHYENYISDLPQRFSKIFPECKAAESVIFAVFDDHCSSYKRLSLLADFAKIAPNSLIAGNAEWFTKIGLGSISIGKSFTPETIQSTKRLMELYQNSKIGLNISHHQTMGDSMPFRCFDILAAGLILVTNNVVAVESRFEENKHYFTFNTIEDLEIIYRKILDNSDLYDEYARESQEIIKENHTFKHRALALIGDDHKKEGDESVLKICSKIPILFSCDKSLQKNVFQHAEDGAQQITPVTSEQLKTSRLHIFYRLMVSIFIKPKKNKSRKQAIVNFINYFLE